MLVVQKDLGLSGISAQVVLRCACLALMLVLAGCQMQSTAGQPFGDYTIFFTQADHIEELLQQDKALEASEVYNKSLGFFQGKGKAHVDLLDKLRGAVEAHFTAEMAPIEARLAAFDAMAPQADWPNIRAAIEAAKDFTDEVKRHHILTHDGFSPLRRQLTDAIDDLEERFATTAGPQMLAYGLNTEPRFDAVYPVDVDIEDVLTSQQDKVRALIDSYDKTALLHLNDRYGDDLPEAIAGALGTRYVNLSMEESQASGKSGCRAT